MKALLKVGSQFVCSLQYTHCQPNKKAKDMM